MVGTRDFHTEGTGEVSRRWEETQNIVSRKPRGDSMQKRREVSLVCNAAEKRRDKDLGIFFGFSEI